MYVQNIYKLVARYSGSLESIVIPRIFIDEAKAVEYARGIVKEKFYDDREIDDVVIYREVPDPEFGCFRTAGTTKIV